MAGESLELGVFGDEAHVAMVLGVEGAKRDILQRVEVVVARQLFTLLLREEKNVGSH